MDALLQGALPEEFEPGSRLHLVSVLGCGVAVAAAVYLGRSWRRQEPLREVKLRRFWAIFVVLFQLGALVVQLHPQNFDPYYSLPFHLCDLVVWVVPIAMWSGKRWSQTLLWFIGLGLSVHAFTMPFLSQGPATLTYWMFWIGHTQIVGSAIYLVSAQGYRPKAKDLFFAAWVLTLYTLIFFPIDIFTGWNYGMLGPDPVEEDPSAVVKLGPWPWRVLILLLLEGLCFFLVYLPFLFLNRLNNGGKGEWFKSGRDSFAKE